MIAGDRSCPIPPTGPPFPPGDRLLALEADVGVPGIAAMVGGHRTGGVNEAIHTTIEQTVYSTPNCGRRVEQRGRRPKPKELTKYVASFPLFSGPVSTVEASRHSDETRTDCEPRVGLDWLEVMYFV